MDKLQQIKDALEIVERGRGDAAKLVKASPIEISIYNIFTNAKRQLDSLGADIEDALGIYMKEKQR